MSYILKGSFVKMLQSFVGQLVSLLALKFVALLTLKYSQDASSLSVEKLIIKIQNVPKLLPSLRLNNMFPHG